MAKRNGTDIRILVGGTTISNLKKVSMMLKGAMIDVTTKDSAGWKEVLPGLRDVTMSGDGSLDFLSAYDPSNIFTKISAGTSVAILFYDRISGDKSYSGTGYFTDFTLAGGTEDEATFTFTIQMTGTTTQVATT